MTMREVHSKRSSCAPCKILYKNEPLFARPSIHTKNSWIVAIYPRKPRARVERDEAITRVIQGDLEANTRIVDENMKTITEELPGLSKQQLIAKPLSLLKTGFWEVARINPPTKLVTEGKLAKLVELAAQADAMPSGC